MNRQRIIAGLVATTTLFFPSAAGAQFLGIDSNGDFECEPWEMGIQVAPGETHTVDVFVSGTAPIEFMACTVCISEKSLISSGSFSYGTPTNWSEITPIQADAINSQSSFPTQELRQQYPGYRCWHAHSYDFAGLDALPIPGYLGSLTFETAGSGCLEFFFDGGYSAVAYPPFEELILFEEPGETCVSVGCPSSATESATWSSIKTLFR